MKMDNYQPIFKVLVGYKAYYVKTFCEWVNKINDKDLMSREELITYLKFFNENVINKGYRMKIDLRHKKFINSLLGDIIAYEI